MSLETSALLDAMLATGQAEDCTLNPDGSPSGATIRVLFNEPYLEQNLDTGVFQNTAPEFYAKASALAGAVVGVTVFRILGADYVAHRIEPVPGGAAWKRVVLNEAP